MFFFTIFLLLFMSVSGPILPTIDQRGRQIMRDKAGQRIKLISPPHIFW